MSRAAVLLVSLLLVAVLACSSSKSDAPPAATRESTPVAGATVVDLGPIHLQRVYPQLSFVNLTGLYQAPDGSSRWFATEQPGRIRVFDDRPDVGTASTYLDITDRVTVSSEEGLLGLAFAPDFASSGAFYVYYAAANPRRTVVSRFRAATASANNADPKSEEVLLQVMQPFPNHKGGQIVFGPDGYLYIGLGDGGSARDPMGNGQNTNVLLGKLLRIDVSGTSNGRAYRVPADNPFVGRSGFRDEIYAYGLRNPWRYSFDAQTGDLWLGDVGQDTREEVDVIHKGGNYGWSVMEGLGCLGGRDGCDRTGKLLPVIDYGTGQNGNCSVSGGFVYRGKAIEGLSGAYVYGDYCSGRIWGLRYDGSQVAAQKELIDSNVNISSFATDRANELYVLAHTDNGGIFKLVP